MANPDRPFKHGPPFDAVVFDCDSTLSAVEGIDQLARRAGLTVDLSKLTADAMEGRVKLEEVYGLRLDRIRPSRTALRLLGELYRRRLVPGAASSIATLKSLEKPVYVVSGGLKQAVVPFVGQLGVAEENVFAVEVHHDQHGQYTGFDEASPMTRSGGKAEVCAALAKKHKSIVVVGDGVTDLEVTKVGVDFIGFGGVIERAAVRAGAPFWLPGPSLAGVLKVVLTPEEIERAAALASASS
ncbi:MAG: HAD-IB family phosphatase [Gemmatimonadota bacterium]